MYDDMEQKLWAEAERVCSLAMQQGLVKERRVMLFTKVKDVNAYLSPGGNFLSAYIQCGVNSSNQLQIYYLYLLCKPSPETPNSYPYLSVIQEDSSQTPKFSDAYFELDIAQNTVRHLTEDIPTTFDQNQAREFLATKVADYLKRCQLSPNSSPEQKLIDDFTEKSTRAS